MEIIHSKVYEYELEKFKRFYPEYCSIIERAFTILEPWIEERWNTIQHTIDLPPTVYLYKHKGKTLNDLKTLNDGNYYNYLGQVIVQDATSIKNLMSATHSNRQIKSFLTKHFSDKKLRRMIGFYATAFDDLYEFMFRSRILSDERNKKRIPPEQAEIYHLIIANSCDKNPTKHFMRTAKQLLEVGKLQTTDYWLKIKKDTGSKDEKKIFNNFKKFIADGKLKNWYIQRIRERGFTHIEILKELEIIMHI